MADQFVDWHRVFHPDPAEATDLRERTRRELGRGEYSAVREFGEKARVPEHPLNRMATGAQIAISTGVPCGWLTPRGCRRAVLAFARGDEADPFYNDGRVLYKATLALWAVPEDPV